MATTYTPIWRQIALRANQFKADSATALNTAYTATTPGTTELGDRAIEFPKLAIDDAILNAGDDIVTAIGENPKSPYRTHFADVTGNISNDGAIIPTTSNTSKPIVGVLGSIFDATDNRELQDRPLPMVRSAKTVTLKMSLYYYASDGKRMWHTRTNVYGDCVIWDKEDQLALLASTPRGTCPFPHGLHRLLVSGGLTYIFRQGFQVDQVPLHAARFEPDLIRIRNFYDAGLDALRGGGEVEG